MEKQSSTQFSQQPAVASASDVVFTRIPLLLSLGASLSVLVVGGLTIPVGLASLVLLIAGGYAGRLLSRRHAQACAQLKAEAQRELARAANVCAVSAPLWIRQIETVRSEADTEIAQLTRVFGGITNKLDKVLGHAGGPDGQEDILGMLSQKGADLDKLIGALSALQASKERIVGDIGSEASRLKESAAEIRQIALHTRMVAMNATIEAARAGQAGKPFAVIVADMRELAVRTAEASEQFSRHTDRLHAMVNAAFEEQTLGATGESVSIPWAQELVRRVIDSFETMVVQLARSIDEMGRERRDVRDDISRVLVSLQFQDRVSQILSHVTRNLQDMHREIEAGRWTSVDTRQWMERMAESYSTPEEFSNLALPPAKKDAEEITYF